MQTRKSSDKIYVTSILERENVYLGDLWVKSFPQKTLKLLYLLTILLWCSNLVSCRNLLDPGESHSLLGGSFLER